MLETIVNRQGHEVEIKIGKDCHPENLGKDICCLVCGLEAENREDVLSISVDCVDGLKSWLSRRGHHVHSKHAILLCSDCLEEI